jgi:hypothetical protein
MLPAIVLHLVLAAAAFAQANFAESFQGVGTGTDSAGGPPALVSRGWVFRNQSRVASSGYSPYWTESAAVGHVGSSLGHGAFAIWQNNQSAISAWAILPPIPNQRAGDPITLWATAWTNAFGMNNGAVEVRYSASGGISTGSGESAVGDFTQVLFTINNTNTSGWTPFTAALPGVGRIAIRLVLPPASSSFEFTGSYNIDSLQIGTPPAAPYPLPAAGQTVHWTTAHSPVLLNTAATGQSPVIPAGGTVIVDPGVEVRCGSNVRFDIGGTLNIQGTAAAPVRFRGPGSMNILKGGLLTAAHADVQVFTDLINGARASFVDSNFSDPSNPTGFSYSGPGDVGRRFFDGNLDYARQIVNLERCTFGQGCQVSLVRGWLAARDCTFTYGQNVGLNSGPVGGEAIFVVGNSILDNVTVNGGYIDLMQNHDQYRYLGNMTITGNIYGPGIRLEGGANYLIDPNVTLQGHKWPINIGVNSAGILPGSRLPSTGNQFNEIPDMDDSAPLDEHTFWADAGIPYIANTIGGAHGQVTILPGVTVKIPADTTFGFDTDSNGSAMPVFLGEPERPIRFIPYTPGTRWNGIGIGNVRWFGTRWDWCIIEDSRFGAGAAELPIAFDNCTFRRNIEGLGGSSRVTIRKCLFENNVYSYTGERFAPLHEVDGFLDANHPANPNTFINNNGDPGPDHYGLSFLQNGGLIARSRHNSLEDTDSDARNNWWGTPDGPYHPEYNPTGTGDAVFFGIDAGGFLTPFLTEPPTTNPPPVVRFVTQPQAAVIPGEKVIFQWTARDDGRIVTQRVYFSPESNFDENMQLLAELPAGARSFEWTVPNVGTSPAAVEEFFRVVAIDDLGQEGIADLPMVITNPGVITGTLTPSPAVSGPFVPGAGPAICFTTTGSGIPMNAAIELDNDETGVSLGGMFPQAGVTCLSLSAQIPDVSTDRARIRYDYIASLNQVKSFYGPYFTIRPDPILGDAAPAVSLTSTHAGRSYPGGTIIPITWTASDDEALRGFDIRASFDGGIRWFIVARDLPAAARSYDWRLPGSSDIPSVHIRVVAKDLRFQNTSAESGLFAITPGAVFSGCTADFNADGLVGVQDIFDFLTAYFAADARADVNHADGVTVQDIFDFLLAYFAGCH